jgi:hypothetical protein
MKEDASLRGLGHSDRRILILAEKRAEKRPGIEPGLLR